MATKPEVVQSKWTAPVMMKDCEIFCPSTCVALGHMFTDGDSKLIVAHGGHRGVNMKLKVFQGVEMQSEISLPDMPIALIHFTNEKNSIPSIAVATGTSLFIYKNLKPFYKFNTPGSRGNETEEQVWAAVANKEINMDTFLHALRNISDQISFSHMAPLSQTYIMAGHDRRLGLLENHASKFQMTATITCVSTITKSTAELVDVIVVGTEQCDLHVVDSQTFGVNATMKIPSIPVTICTYGYYSVDYRFFIQTRDSLVFVVKKGELENKAIIVSQSMITSMVLMNKLIVYATCENIISFNSFRGKKINTARCPGKIKMLEPFHYTHKQLSAVIAVFDKEIRMYDESYLLDIQKFEKPVAWVKFGCYGREDSTLITCFKDGTIALQIFRRTASFQTRMDYNPTPPAHALKLAIPKKTKIFIDQTQREIQYSNKIHQNYQKDLFNLRFKIAEEYAQLVSSASATVSTNSLLPVEIAVDIHGFGPNFRMNIILLSSSDKNLYDMYLSIMSDPELYEFNTPLIPVSFMAPAQSYTFTTLLLCKDPEKAANCEIRALLIRPDKPTPIVTAVIKMPFSEFPLD